MMDRRIDLTVNRLPVPTWRWLGMNEAHLRNISPGASIRESVQLPEELETDCLPCNDPDTALMGGFAIPETGMGRDMDRLLKASHIPVSCYHTQPHRSCASPVRLVYHAAGSSPDEIAAGASRFLLEEGSSLTVLMDVVSDAGASGTSALQTRLYLKKGAHLRLVQIQRPSARVTCLNDIGAVCEEGAHLELIRVILSGADSFDGCRVDLSGRNASFTASIGYQGVGDSHLDLNYICNHQGRGTTSSITANGVLCGSASKLLRATIDLQRGCAGAVGEEMEDVLLLDESVRCQTIPLILCSEEDVVGNHGATIGRLDEDMLFYLQSRGMKEQEIYEMMAKAKLNTIISRIPDEELRGSLQACDLCVRPGGVRCPR